MIVVGPEVNRLKSFSVGLLFQLVDILLSLSEHTVLDYDILLLV